MAIDQSILHDMRVHDRFFIHFSMMQENVFGKLLPRTTKHKMYVARAFVLSFYDVREKFLNPDSASIPHTYRNIRKYLLDTVGEQVFERIERDMRCSIRPEFPKVFWQANPLLHAAAMIKV